MAVSQHVAAEARDQANLLLYHYPDVEGELAGHRYAQALTQPYGEPGMTYPY